MACSIKVGKKYRVYGCGTGSNADIHDGEIVVVDNISHAKGCTGDIEIYGCSFSDKSYDWFVAQQLVAYKGSQKK